VLPKNTPVKLEPRYNGEDCIVLAVRRYKELPWFANLSEVAAPFDIISNGKNIMYFFHQSQPVSNEDEVALFRGIVKCLQFLQSKGLALKKIKKNTFCHAEGEFPCRLSLHCQVKHDPHGKDIVTNKQLIFKLGYFKNIRIRHALCESQEIGRLLEHPTTWGFAQDVSLLFHFIAYDKKQPRDLNQMIKYRKMAPPNGTCS
jgi:hypothetical protein